MTTDPIWLWLPGATTPVHAADYSHDPATLTGTWRFRADYLARDEAYTPDPLHLPLNERAHAVRTQDGWAGTLIDAAPGFFGRKMLREALGQEPAEHTVLTTIPCHGSGALLLGDATPARLGPPPRYEDIDHSARLILSGAIPPQTNAAMLSAMKLQPTTGGAKPKLDLLDTDGVPSLLKFADIGDPASLPRVEAATLRLAIECGIEAPMPRIATFEGSNGAREALLLHRFDRSRASDVGIAHLAYASAHTVLGLTGATENFASYTALAHELQRWCARGADAEHGLRQRRELWRRICFNALVGSTDDHARNHAVIRKDGAWQLSPAFDLVPFGRGRDTTCSLRMPFDRDARLQVATPEALIVAAKVYGWDARDAHAMLHGMAQRVVDRFEPLLREWEVPDAEIRIRLTAIGVAREVCANS
jgi:serine/threonine-protein kinase HipA